MSSSGRSVLAGAILAGLAEAPPSGAHHRTTLRSAADCWLACDCRGKRDLRLNPQRCPPPVARFLHRIGTRPVRPIARGILPFRESQTMSYGLPSITFYVCPRNYLRYGKELFQLRLGSLSNGSGSLQ